MEKSTRGPGRASTLLFIISLCNGISNPLLALQRAVDDAQLLGNDVVISRTFIFENDPLVNEMAKAALRKSQYPGEIMWMGDIALFPDLAKNFTSAMLLNWKYRIIVLSGTPCKSISRACKMNPLRKKFGLHAEPSNLWWQAHRGLCFLQEVHGRYLLTFVENVIPVSADLLQLDSSAGFRHSMNVPSCSGPSRERFMWSNWKCDIPVFAPLSGTAGPNSRMSLPSPFQYVSCTAKLPCLRAIFPRLFCMLQIKFRV